MRDEGSWATANELLRSGQYLAAVAICTDVLVHGPSCDWLLLRARAHIALNQRAYAERDLRRCLALNPGSPDVRATLADLARDQGPLRAGEHYQRSAKRVSTVPGSVRQILLGLTQSTGAVEKLPAATASVGWNSRRTSPPPIPADAKKRAPLSVRPPIFKTTKRIRRLAEGTTPSGKRPKHIVRPQRFGEYLVALGHLSKDQIRAVLAFHRSHGVRTGTAAVMLGFLSEPKVEWAAHSFHEGRKRRA